MKWLVVALVLLQTCWGSHPKSSKTSGNLVLPSNVGEWTDNMEKKGFYEGDISSDAAEDVSQSEEEEEYADQMEVSPWKEEEEYPDEMEVSPSKEEEESPDEMVALPDNEERELLDVEEIAPSGEDSIVITKRSSKIGSQWPNGVIPYEISGVSGETRKSIFSAIADFNKYTCIRFVKRTGQTKYAFFTDKGKDTGCNSPVGVPKGSRNVNTINLEAPGCQKHGTVLHEMCHTIGLHHEQTRVDRDKFVTFIRQNVKPNMFEVNFQSSPNDPKYWKSFKTKYDYYSIMHYGAFAFSINKEGGLRTIITKDKDVQYLIGRMDHMSPVDAEQINLMYNCPRWQKYTKPPVYECVDTKSNCDAYIAKYKCPKIYFMCCESCRGGRRRVPTTSFRRTVPKLSRGSGSSGRRRVPTTSGRRRVPPTSFRRPVPSGRRRVPTTSGRRRVPTTKRRRMVTVITIRRLGPGTRRSVTTTRWSK